MQRIEALIDKLKLQYQNRASNEQLLATLQLLQQEITGGLKETSVLGSSLVSVLMPNAPSVNQPLKVADVFSDDEKVYFELPETHATDDEILELLEQSAKATVQKKEVPEKTKENESTFKSQPEFDFNEDLSLLNQVPTFAQHTNGRQRGSARQAKEVQVKQLKKAISDEDRQEFLTHLFRGDEAMYERSIKTIDNFDTHAEAEFWIRRELKTKIGWPMDSATAANFDKIVKKRFA